MKRNIILAMISFIGVSTIIIIRKNWKVYLIFLAIMGVFLIIAGISGLIINPFL